MTETPEAVEHDAEQEIKNQALIVRDPNEPVQEKITPTQARIESVAAALDAAYKNASTLKLTVEEAKLLEEDFPDEAFRRGAGGDEKLIYIEHAYLRRRLNQVLGVGAAVPIRRREWAEQFNYWKDGKNKTGVRVYVDLALLVRGCLVGEAIGDAVYYPDNAKTNYSDALESAKSNAFRRCCKEFGVGLQAWMKGWCEGWEQRNSGRKAPAQSKPQPTQRSEPPTETAPRAARTPKPATAEDVLPKAATKATRDFALKELSLTYSLEDIGAFLKAKGWLDGTNNWNLPNVPTSRAEISKLAAEIGKWLGGGELPTEDELPPEIANVKITMPRKGEKRAEYLTNPDTIGSLREAGKNGDEYARGRLWWLATKWVPEGYQGRPPSQEDLDCREGLDAYLEWHEAREGVTP